MPSRRAVLATTGTALAAGCLAEPGDPGPNSDSGPTADPDDERTPTGDAHTVEPPDGCTGGIHVTARPFDPAADLTVRLDDPGRSLVATAVETGAAAVELYADSPPVDDGVYVEHEGAYYETAIERVDTTEVPAVVTNVEWEEGQVAPGDASPVHFDDLPAVDRAALRFAVDGEPLSRERGGHPTQGLSVRENPVPYPDGTDGSVLVGDGTTWVRWRDRTYRVWTGGETTGTRHEFRIDAVRAADDADAFRSHVAEEYLVELVGLSDGVRGILRTARGGTYEECGDPSEDLAALLGRLPDDASLPPPKYDAWYVSVEGTRSVLAVRRWVH